MTRGGGACRITVVGSRRRVDLTVPAGTAVIELLPQVVQLTGEGERPAPGGWRLTRLGGRVLDPEGSLAEACVLDGEQLYLAAADGAAPAPAVEDFVEAVAEQAEASGGTWTPARARQLLEALAGVLWLTGAVVAVRAATAAGGEAGWALPALGIAAGLEAAAAVLRWVLRRRLAGAVAAMVAIALWVLGGVELSIASGERSALGLTLAAAAGLLVAAGFCGLLVPRLRHPAVATILAVAGLAGAGAAVRSLPVNPVQVAGAGTILVLAAITVLPRAAARVTGLTRPGRSLTEPASGLEVARVRGLLAWLLAAAGVDLAVALAVLAATPDGAARWLCAAASLSVLLRSRHHRFIAEVLPLALAGAAGALALELALLAGSAPAVRLSVVLETGAALVVLTWVPFDRLSSAHARSWLSRIEVVANMTLVPLMFAAGGLFAAAAELGRRLASA